MYLGRGGFTFGALLACLGATTAPSPPPSPSPARVAVLGALLGGLGRLTGLGSVCVNDLAVLVLFGFNLLDRFLDDRFLDLVGVNCSRDTGRLCGERPGLIEGMDLLAFLDDERQLAADRSVGRNRHGDLEAMFQVVEVGALVIEHIERNL